MKTTVKPPLAEAMERTRSTTRHTARPLPTKKEPPRKSGSHFAVTFGWALVCIANPDLRARVETILAIASKVTGTTAEDVNRQLAQPAKGLRKLALGADEVLEALIVIVEGGVREPRSPAIYCLVFQVVACLLVEDCLDRASGARGAGYRCGLV